MVYMDARAFVFIWAYVFCYELKEYLLTKTLKLYFNI